MSAGQNKLVFFYAECIVTYLKIRKVWSKTKEIILFFVERKFLRVVMAQSYEKTVKCAKNCLIFVRGVLLYTVVFLRIEAELLDFAFLCVAKTLLHVTFPLEYIKVRQ